MECVNLFTSYFIRIHTQLTFDVMFEIAEKLEREGYLKNAEKREREKFNGKRFQLIEVAHIFLTLHDMMTLYAIKSFFYIILKLRFKGI